MLYFEATNIEELEIEAQKRAHEVSVFTTTAIIEALNKGADKVVVGILSTLNLDKAASCVKSLFSGRLIHVCQGKNSW